MNHKFRTFTALMLAGTMTLGLGIMPGYAAETGETAVETAADLSAQEAVQSLTTSACAGAAIITDAIANGELVSLNHATEVAGIGVGLHNYYESVANETVSEKKSLKIAEIVDERAEVLDNYKKIGIADVNGTNYLNVRKKPSTDAKLAGKMTNNNVCEILKKSKDGEWYKVRSGSVTGYVYAEYIITGTDAKKLAIENAEKLAVVTDAENLNVRKKPSTDAKILTKISEDERYEVVKVKNGWVKINLGEDEDGKNIYGYISSDYCDIKYDLYAAAKYIPPEEASAESGSSTSSTSVRSGIANYGCQFIGNPYVWGGTSLTHGADCSGFVMSVFAKYGIYLPHSSAAQAYCGTSISSSQLQAGDLVFYGSGGINHVAIYIGGGMIVHAANPRRGIVINSMNYMTPVKYVNVLGSR